MRLIRSLLFVLALTVPAAAVEPADVLRKAVDNYIRPAFSQLAGRTLGLTEDLDNLCGMPSPTQLELVRQQFGKVVLAYSRVEFLRFGPLTEDSRAERLLFWPDRKGIALRQVQAILAEHDETTTAIEDLRQKSIAVQGLSALEYVLYGDRSETLGTIEADFRCRYALTIGEAINATAQELAQAWSAPDGIAAHIAKPQPEYDDYRTDREALEELVGAVAHGLEAIRDTKLLPFVGREGEAPKPKSALFWRSGLTVPAIRAGFEGLNDFLHATGLAEVKGGIAGRPMLTDKAFTASLEAADKVTSPIAEALDDPAQKAALDQMVAASSELQTLIGEGLSTALRLSVGFSSLDGD
jgi:uncharacterized protein